MPKVSVTQEHIDRAKPKDSGHCMIALAIAEQIPNARRVWVDLQTIRYTLPQKEVRYTYFTPRIAQLMLLAFDHGGEVVLGNERIPLQPFACGLGRVVVEHEARDTGERKDRKRKIVHKKSKQHSPTQRGGKPLPRGAVGAVARRSSPHPHALMVGRRREYGLKAMGRPPELVGQELEG